VATVHRALARAGHDILEVPCNLDLGHLWQRLDEIRPQAAFNLVESLGGRDRFLSFVPALLEERGLPFTGSGAEASHLCGSKILTKKALADAGLPVLPTAAIWPPKAETSRLLDDTVAGPFVVKSIWNHGSAGLDDGWQEPGLSAAGGAAAPVSTFVADRRQLEADLPRLGRHLGGSCLAEPYLHGREFNLALLATHQGVQALPPAEIVFENFPEGRPHLVGYRAKWDTQSFEYQHTLRRLDFSPGEEPLLQRLQQLALEAWRVCGVEGYARVDFRVDGEGEPFLLEVNANPCLSPDAGFAAAVHKSGRTLEEAIDEILRDALRRASPVWP